MFASAVSSQPISISARDGYELAGTVYQPAGDPTGTVLIVPGTAIPASLYRHLAADLAEQGNVVLTYDYRGIGNSRRGAMNGFAASVEDWADLDTGGAIDWLAAQHPNLPSSAITHSFGAVMLLGTPGAHRLRQIVMVSPHTGYWGDYRWTHRLPMALLWHGVMPLVTKTFGYFPAARLRLGQDIPATVALQWAQRWHPTLRPYGQGAQRERSASLIAQMQKIDGRVVAVEVSDDAFATAAGTDRVATLIPQALLERVEVTPAMANQRRLGHFGVFSRRSRDLWPQLWPQLFLAN